MTDISGRALLAKIRSALGHQTLGFLGSDHGMMRGGGNHGENKGRAAIGERSGDANDKGSIFA